MNPRRQLPAARLAGKAGYTLLEMMVALAIMTLGAALIIPRAAGAMDQVVAHSVFFDFQRQVSDLRRRAFRAQTPVMLVTSKPETSAGGVGDAASSGAAVQGDPDAEAQTATATLRSGWSYKLSAPLKVSSGGACDKVVADLIHQGAVRVHLTSNDDACHFTRLW